MPTLIIQRRREWMNAMRNYKIFIGGKLAGKIANGKEVRFDLPAGDHTVVAKIDWCQSGEEELTLAEGESRTLYVGMHKRANWSVPLFTSIIALYIALRFTAARDWSFLLSLPVLGYLIYLLTAGRKKYLVLEDQSAGRVL